MAGSSYLSRGVRFLFRVMSDTFDPRAIAWRYRTKRFPKKEILTGLGKDLKVRIHPYDVIGKEIYIKGLFEKAEALLAQRLLKPGMVFMDIGANLGQYTLLAARSVGPEGRVHSFEPSARMFAELAFNVELNDLSGICRLNNLAISDRDGYARLSLYEPGREVYGSLGTQGWCDSKVVGHESVRTTTLDAYIERNAIRRVDLIKIDIEGAELPALKGAAGLLRRDDGPIILIEIADVNTAGFGYKAVEIIVHLESLGYQVHRLDARGRFHEMTADQKRNPLEINAIAIKRARTDPFMNPAVRR